MDERRRAMIRSIAAAVLAVATAGVAYLAPGVVSGETPESFGIWLRGCALAAVVVLFVVVVANLVRGSGTSRALAGAVAGLGVLLLVAIALGGLYFMLEDTPAQDAFGLGVIVAIPVAGAIALAHQTRTAVWTSQP